MYILLLLTRIELTQDESSIAVKILFPHCLISSLEFCLIIIVLYNNNYFLRYVLIHTIILQNDIEMFYLCEYYILKCIKAVNSYIILRSK